MIKLIKQYKINEYRRFMGSLQVQLNLHHTRLVLCPSEAHLIPAIYSQIKTTTSSSQAHSMCLLKSD